MMDAFTTSATYPYARHYRSGHASASTTCATASRRSIDAYDGTVTFYVFDAEDPIIAATARSFPSLFKDASAMPADAPQARPLSGADAGRCRRRSTACTT